MLERSLQLYLKNEPFLSDFSRLSTVNITQQSSENLLLTTPTFRSAFFCNMSVAVVVEIAYISRIFVFLSMVSLFYLFSPVFLYLIQPFRYSLFVNDAKWENLLLNED